jgi:antirestriction protein ArdC
MLFSLMGRNLALTLQRITDQIVAAIEAGASIADFRMPWHSADALPMPHNAFSQHKYRGINVPIL